jgi:excisionase family DNA binding protein
MNLEVLTIRELANLLKINEKTAYKLAASGKIPGFKVGGSWRFERQEIENWIKRKVEEQRKGGKSDD